MCPSFSTSLAILCALVGVPLAAAQAPPAPAPPSKTTRPATKAARQTAGAAALQKQATAAREAGDLDKAVGLYQKALALDSDWSEGWWGLGTTCYDLERFAEANDAFRRVLAKDDGNATAWVFKGLSSFRLKRYDEALAELLQAGQRGALGNREVSEAARYHLAILMIRVEQYEQALAVLSQFGLEGNDQPRIIEAMGLATLRMPMLPDDLPGTRRELVMLAGRAQYFAWARQLPAAKSAFETLTARYPDTPNVHYAYGVMLMAEEPERAIELLQRELRLSPTHALAKIQIAFACINRGDFAEAKRWAEPAVQEAPTMFIARHALGQAQFGLGEVDAAIDTLEAAVKLAPDSPAVRFSLARAYRAAKRTVDADREQAEFTRLDRLVRRQRLGENAIGGMAPPK